MQFRIPAKPILIWLIGLTALLGYAPHAQAKPITAPTILSDSVEFDFPNAATFQLSAQSDVNITEVRFEFGHRVNDCGNDLSYALPDFEAGKQVEVSYEWNMRATVPLPPGAQIWYRWVITDANGQQITSERTELTWLDDKHDWQEIEKDTVVLHWYAGRDSFAEQLLNTAVQAKADIANAYNISTDNKVHFYIYKNTNEMRDSLLFEPQWTGGQAFSDQNIVVIGIGDNSSDLEWGLRTVAHEFTHVIVGNVVSSCYASVPTWFNEGIAMYIEGEDASYEKGVLDDAIKSGDLFALRPLSNGFTEDPDKANLAYLQSKSIVGYLVKTYGKEKMQALLQAFNQGYQYDNALQIALGVQLEELERNWRASVGASELPLPTAGFTATPTIFPTYEPYSAVLQAETPTVSPVQATLAAQPTRQSGDIPPSSNSDNTTLGLLVFAAIGALCCLGLVAFVGIVVWVMRKSGGKK
ncbi:MAG TPA: peptidase MA family metallohydrolase [Anaerolineales bacterium]|nr:peptidase MA family metallohydrolase [Anaerolineales bacterium]